MKLSYSADAEDFIINLYKDNPPEKAVLAIGGCPYCAMTGYEDYPTGKKPCRLGHINEADEFAEKAKKWGSASSINGFGL